MQNTTESYPLPPVFDDFQSLDPELETFTSYDGFELWARTWRGVTGAPTVLYLHGIEGHAQWFENTATVLNRQGVTVCALDRRGAGLNRENRGDMRGHEVFLRDVETVLRTLARKNPNSPLILLANCWSAKAAAVLTASNYQPLTEGSLPDIKGLVMTAPAICTKVDVDFGTKLRIALSLAGVNPTGLAKIPLTLPMFTSERKYLDYLEKDPMRLTEASLRFFFQTFWVGLLAKSSAPKILLPVYVIQSENDEVIDVDGVRSWFNKLGSSEKEMRVLPSKVHSLDFDPVCFNEYADTLCRWILRFAPVAPAEVS